MRCILPMRIRLFNGLGLGGFAHRRRRPPSGHLEPVMEPAARWSGRPALPLVGYAFIEPVAGADGPRLGFTVLEREPGKRGYFMLS